MVLHVFVDESDPALREKNQAFAAAIAETSAQPTYLVVDPATREIGAKFGYRRSFLTEPRTFVDRLMDGARRLRPNLAH